MLNWDERLTKQYKSILYIEHIEFPGLSVLLQTFADMVNSAAAEKIQIQDINNYNLQKPDIQKEIYEAQYEAMLN